MAKIDLLPNEVILKQDSNIMHDRGRFFDAWDDKLVLTNFALLVVHKGALGNTKETVRFPLEQLKQAVYGKARNGERQLHVYFSHGVEAFSLGKSDEDEDIVTLKSLFTPQAEKEKNNILDWCDAISKAKTAMLEEQRIQNMMKASEPPKAAPSKITPPDVTKKCIGCMAPITGPQGSRVVCKYCDTEQAV